MNFLLPLLALAFFSPPKKAARLEILVQNVAPEKGGSVRIAIYADESAFLKPEKAVLLLSKAVEKGQTTARFEFETDEKAIAIAAFQDENNDSKLSTNWLGIPSEAYGFSNGARPKFRAATWAEARVELPRGTSKWLEIKLENW